jgi:hypothetical protein
VLDPKAFSFLRSGGTPRPAIDHQEPTSADTPLIERTTQRGQPFEACGEV